ncbi:hypothetical protein BVG18_17285 [Acinetobacter lwoffii]|nr:hypothetical protein BVG18_17285 [Acinetobacter lwoffii]
MIQVKANKNNVTTKAIASVFATILLILVIFPPIYPIAI